MKSTFRILTAAALCLAPLASKADVLALTGRPAIDVFAASSTNQVSALSWAVVTARSGNNGTPVVTFVGAGSDLASGKIITYKVNAQCVVTFTNSTTTLFVNNTNGFDQASVIIIRHKLTDDYEKRIQTSNSGATNLIVTVAPFETVVPGDQVYQCTTTGAMSYLQGAVTNTLAAPGGIFVGQQGLPLLLEVSGTSAASLYSVSGFFAPPVVAGRITAPSNP